MGTLANPAEVFAHLRGEDVEKHADALLVQLVENLAAAAGPVGYSTLSVYKLAAAHMTQENGA